MWSMYSAIGQGISHKQSDLVCQDRTYVMENEIISVIALADGAGSYAHSEEGAELITYEISKFMLENYSLLFNDENNIIEIIKNQIIDRLTEYAQEKNYELDDLSSTLLLVAIDKINKTFITIHIGDGVIGVNRKSELLLLSDSQNGDSPNMTFMTTSENLERYLRVQKAELESDINGFVLLSDGGAHVLFDHQAKMFTKNAHKIVDHAISGRMTLELLDSFTNEYLVQKCKVFDDCSIAILAKVDNNIIGEVD